MSTYFSKKCWFQIFVHSDETHMLVRWHRQCYKIRFPIPLSASSNDKLYHKMLPRKICWLRSCSCESSISLEPWSRLYTCHKDSLSRQKVNKRSMWGDKRLVDAMHPVLLVYFTRRTCLPQSNEVRYSYIIRSMLWLFGKDASAKAKVKRSAESFQVLIPNVWFLSLNTIDW